jgi:Zn-dependent peptidase ImmA (M78 family)
MAKTVLFKIEPAILRYARKYSGFSVEEVAKKTKIKIDKLKEYEDKETEIPVSHLNKLSTVYKRALVFFLLKSVPADAVEPKDFRIVYASGEELFSPDALLAIRRARYIQSSIAELAENNFNYDFPIASINTDTDELAAWLRNYLGVKISDQHKWSSPAIALKEWKLVIESKEIFILQQNLSKDDISAFCFVDKNPYLIMLNSAEHENRRIFSLFHEMGHIFLRKSGICTPEDLSRNSYQYIKIEKFCNQFSASFLLPKNEFICDPSVINLVKIPFNRWLDEDLNKISIKYRVSKEVILRRCLTLGFINENDYKNKRNEWIKKSEEFKKIKKKGK